MTRPPIAPMLVVTTAAADALHAIVVSTPRRTPARVRLARDVTSGASAAFALALVDIAEHDDVILRTASGPLFIERVSAPLLAGMVLDRRVEADTDRFVLTTAPLRSEQPQGA